MFIPTWGNDPIWLIILCFNIFQMGCNHRLVVISNSRHIAAMPPTYPNKNRRNAEYWRNLWVSRASCQQSMQRLGKSKQLWYHSRWFWILTKKTFMLGYVVGSQLLQKIKMKSNKTNNLGYVVLDGSKIKVGFCLVLFIAGGEYWQPSKGCCPWIFGHIAGNHCFCQKICFKSGFFCA